MIKKCLTKTKASVSRGKKGERKKLKKGIKILRSTQSGGNRDKEEGFKNNFGLKQPSKSLINKVEEDEKTGLNEASRSAEKCKNKVSNF